MNEILKRKGARKIQDIPKEVMTLLNQGEIETVNLTEWLAIDHVELIRCTFDDLGISTAREKNVLKQVNAQKESTAMKTIKVVGAALYSELNGDAEFMTVLSRISAHKSDSIRCYAPYLIALNEDWSLDEKLERAKPLVADHHFGLREVVWMAMRPDIDRELERAIELLTKWADDPDENIRRFTTEATRPRGVWCKHIEALKEKPARALPILQKLRSDSSKFVQDSVGNWLNDASKSDPGFVIDLCEEWMKESPTKETEKIVKRARRTLDKK